MVLPNESRRKEQGGIMDKYIKCLKNVNESVIESSVANFAFRDYREAVIFAHWMRAILPVNEERCFRLPGELGWCNENGEFYPLLSESMVSIDPGLLQRRLVRFVAPLQKTTSQLGQDIQEFDHVAYKQEIDKISKEGLNPQSFILVELNRESHPKYNEAFWEYIAGCHFRKLGYLITHWTPNDLPGGGCPDMAAYRIPSLLDPLRRFRFIEKGCFLVELELPFICGDVNNIAEVQISDCHSVVIEAKSRSSHEKAAVDQLVSRGGNGGYLQGGHFDEGYIVGPDFDGKGHSYGSISNTPEGQLAVIPFRRKTSCALAETRDETLTRLEHIAKQALIKNLSLRSLQRLCLDRPINDMNFRGFLNELSRVVEDISVDEVCSLVQEERSNRQ